MSGYEKMKWEIMQNKCTSFWLQKAIYSLDSRDVVNVMRDIEMLRDLFTLKVGEVMDGRV